MITLYSQQDPVWGGKTSAMLQSTADMLHHLSHIMGEFCIRNAKDIKGIFFFFHVGTTYENIYTKPQ